MTPILILTTVFLYFAFLLYISFRAKRNASNAAFFSGNRQSRWYVVAFAMIGASISGVTFVSVPGMVAQSGFGYLQLMLGFIVGQCIIAYVLVPLFYRIGLTSAKRPMSPALGSSSYPKCSVRRCVCSWFVPPFSSWLSGLWASLSPAMWRYRCSLCGSIRTKAV